MSANLSNEMPLVHMENIGRTFGNITALEGVNFDIGYQEVIGLLGDNGAGKSTLIKVLTGIHTPTTGQIYFEGRPVQIDTPQAARELGIETVYQDLALVPLMSIARNFYLGREPTVQVGPIEIMDQETMRARTTEALDHIGIKIRSAGEPVGTLSGGERQSIAIGRAVHFGTKLLILDEPTSALSIGETRKVLNYTLEAKRRGLSVIFITHNIHHIFEVADRFTIISHGHKVGDFRKEDVNLEEVSGMIMGEPVPERLKDAPPLSVSTRPPVIKTNGNGTSAQAEADRAAALAAADAMHKQLERRRQFNRIGWGLFALFLVFVFGSAYYYSRPEAENTDLVPPLNNLVKAKYIQVKYPDGWRVERSEANILQIKQNDRDWSIVFNWEPSKNVEKISPTKPLADNAKIMHDNDFAPRQYQPGTEITIGGRPAYRSDWINSGNGRKGVEYIFFDDLNNIYDVFIDAKSDDIERITPLADAIMQAVTFSG